MSAFPQILPISVGYLTSSAKVCFLVRPLVPLDYKDSSQKSPGRWEVKVWRENGRTGSQNGLDYFWSQTSDEVPECAQGMMGDFETRADWHKLPDFVCRPFVSRFQHNLRGCTSGDLLI